MALPSEARRRWNLTEGGTVEIADLGELLVVAPASRGGIRGALRQALDEVGGYAQLAVEVGEAEPDLA